MTEQQQKLYDKLLKKVNEYCLGQAVEDVVAAIDDLIESYETLATDTVTNQSAPFRALNTIKEQMPGYDEVGTVEVSRTDIRFIEKSLKALEIIKEKLMPYVEKYEELGYVIECDMIAIGIPQEEYELLEEVLK